MNFRNTAFFKQISEFPELNIIQIFIFLFCFFTCIICKLPFIDGIVYFLFQFFSVLIPGFILAALLKIESEDGIEIILKSYTLGLLFLLIEYPLTMIFKISSFIWLINILIAAVSVFFIYRENEKFFIRKRNRDIYVLMIFILVITCLCFFSVSLANPIYRDNDIYLNKDFLFWVGNSLSFTKSFPAQDYRLPGIPFFYHYFSSIVIAQSSFITGSSPVELSFYFSYIIPCILLVLSAYYMLKQLIERKNLLFIGIFLILMTEGSTSFLINHLYFCPFGYDYACAVSMFAVGFLLKMYKNDSFTIRNMLFSCLLIAMDTGFKATTSLVMLMGFGIVAFDMLIHKKYLKGFICGFSWLAAFLLVYLTCISDLSGTTQQTNDLQFVGIIQAFENNFLAMMILNDLMINYGLSSNPLTLLLTLFLYIMRSNRPAMYLFAVCAIYLIIDLFKNKRISLICLMLNMICFWGIMITINTYQDGNSQIYFIMSMFPFGVLGGLYVLEQNFMSSKYLKIAAFIFLLLISYDDVNRFYERAKPEIVNAVNSYLNQEVIKNNKILYAKQDRVLTDFLKENTGNTDYIAVDSFTDGDIRKDEVIGVFAERFVWNDGQYGEENERARRRKLIDDFFLDPDQFEGELIDQSIKYVVRTLSVNPDFDDEGLKRVFQSEEYIVYKLD